MMRYYTFYKYIWMATAILLVWGFFVYPDAKSALPTTEKELVVNVVPLKKQDVDITNQYVGYVVPIKSVNMVANVSGYIDEVWAEGGQSVRQGDNLVLIDQREYKANQLAAEAAKAQAVADLDNAKTYYERMKKAGAKAISASALDEAKANYLAADAALKQAEANLEKATVMLDYTVLQAPIDGVLGEVSLTKGNYVAPNGKALFNIVQFDPIRVQFAISDKEYLTKLEQQKSGGLLENEKIKIRLADGNVYPFSGVFKYADNQTTKETNSISLFADFANKDRMLMANSYVDVLLERKMKGVYLIKQNYVTISEEGPFVYVVKKNKLRQEPIKIGGYYKEYYVAQNQFAPDDFLVTDKIGMIEPETKLKIKIVPDKSEKK